MLGGGVAEINPPGRPWLNPCVQSVFRPNAMRWTGELGLTFSNLKSNIQAPGNIAPHQRHCLSRCLAEQDSRCRPARRIHDFSKLVPGYNLGSKLLRFRNT